MKSPCLAVTPESSEVLQNTQATISCVVAGLTKKLDAVAWQRGDQAITSGVDDFTIDEGTFASETNSQTSVLTVPAASNAESASYGCYITSDEHAVTAQKVDVNVNVFSKYYYRCFILCQVIISDPVQFEIKLGKRILEIVHCKI